MERQKTLIEALRRDLVAAKLQHVQCLMGSYRGHLTVKFTSVDTDEFRARLQAITDRYCESLVPVKATKTTRVFAI